MGEHRDKGGRGNVQPRAELNGWQLAGSHRVAYAANRDLEHRCDLLRFEEGSEFGQGVSEDLLGDRDHRVRCCFLIERRDADLPVAADHHGLEIVGVDSPSDLFDGDAEYLGCLLGAHWVVHGLDSA